ncbi:PorP/SprF family type IX secretion system membrane protein [Pontibacter sp. E15-1]|uniref:PorP/SprF family type IX secretion system membrane protein n=1 Tax=Pontibacter sp. E15-1 TaxID=2919918 RepID=UPI001F4F823F|nr:PorP/SprF family type IX secretion system membrane protein [Pontibacter sp. E15-1]MCJ8166734.1 PorP/SprF family type IX secretion system membrane protein [Pontibacter sp. E15-1]
MKRLLLCIALALAVYTVQGQGRKQIANFSQYKHFYNPSLTGYDGSVVRTLYRNQWTGFEDAPKTLLATAEVDLGMLGHKSNNYRFDGRESRGAAVGTGARHALGLILLHDQFGPAKESLVGLNYGSAIRLSESVSLRWGSALTYRMQRFDGNSLTVDQENDPRYTGVLGNNNRSNTLDLNLGLSLVTARYYVGYAMQDITAGSVVSSGDDFLRDFYTRKHVAQAGYRASLGGDWGYSVNGIYQYDKLARSTVEGQVKAIYQHAFWAGAGYRNDQAYNLTAGLRLGELSVGYTYETPIQDASAITKSTNEIALSYTLMPSKTKAHSKLPQIW